MKNNGISCRPMKIVYQFCNGNIFHRNVHSMTTISAFKNHTEPFTYLRDLMKNQTNLR